MKYFIPVMRQGKLVIETLLNQGVRFKHCVMNLDGAVYRGLALTDAEWAYAAAQISSSNAEYIAIEDDSAFIVRNDLMFSLGLPVNTDKKPAGAWLYQNGTYVTFL